MGCGIWFPTNYESLSDGEDEEIEIGEKKKISNGKLLVIPLI